MLVCFWVKLVVGDKDNGYMLNKKFVEVLNIGGDIMFIYMVRWGLLGWCVGEGWDVVVREECDMVVRIGGRYVLGFNVDVGVVM